MSSGTKRQKRAAPTSSYNAPSFVDAPTSSLSTLEDLLLNNDVWRDTLLPYLDPIDLIRLIHTSKSIRRIAAPLLNKLETKSNQTVCHAEMFSSFLRNPRVTKSNKVWEELTTDEARASTAGPLRLYHIKEKASEIQKRFAILRYSKTYDMEQSLVILFDEKGAYIGHYKFESEQFYEDYATKNIMQGGNEFGLGRNRVFNARGGSNTSMPEMGMCYTDNNWKWKMDFHAQTDYNWQEGWLGSFVDPHTLLIDSFVGNLSPVEAMFVLMHALSSDTRVIYVVVVSFFDNFDLDFDMILLEDNENDDDENDEAALIDFRQKLSSVSYTLDDSELLAVADTLFANSKKTNELELEELEIALLKLDSTYQSIATHFGWSEVDARRKRVVAQHLTRMMTPKGMTGILSS